jgi:hypothetical protein
MKQMYPLRKPGSTIKNPTAYCRGLRILDRWRERTTQGKERKSDCASRGVNYVPTG